MQTFWRSLRWPMLASRHGLLLENGMPAVFGIRTQHRFRFPKTVCRFVDVCADGVHRPQQAFLFIVQLTCRQRLDNRHVLGFHFLFDTVRLNSNRIWIWECVFYDCAQQDRKSAQRSLARKPKMQIFNLRIFAYWPRCPLWAGHVCATQAIFATMHKIA